MMLHAIWLRIAPYVLTAAAVLAVALGLYARGRQAGKAAEQARQISKVLKATEVRRDVETDIRRDAGAARDRLRDWSRH